MSWSSALGEGSSRFALGVCEGDEEDPMGYWTIVWWGKGRGKTEEGEKMQNRLCLHERIVCPDRGHAQQARGQ
eukprot:519571-Amorphochlora_amoeboformis.AAC.1